MKKFLFAFLIVALTTAVFGPAAAFARDNTPSREYRTVPSCWSNNLNLSYQVRHYNYLTKTWGDWRIIETKHIKDGCAPKLTAPVKDSFGARLNFAWVAGSRGPTYSGRLEAIGIGKGYSTCLINSGDLGCLAFAATDVFQPNGSWFEIFLIPSGSYQPLPLLVVRDTACPYRPAHTCFSLGPNQELTAVIALPDEMNLINR